MDDNVVGQEHGGSGREGDLYHFCEVLDRPAKLEKMRVGFRCECGELIMNLGADEADLKKKKSN